MAVYYVKYISIVLPNWQVRINTSALHCQINWIIDETLIAETNHYGQTSNKSVAFNFLSAFFALKIFVSKMYFPIKEGGYIWYFWPFTTTKITIVTAFLGIMSLLKRGYFERKEFAPDESRFIPFKVDPFSEGRQHNLENFERVTSREEQLLSF